MSVIFDDDFSAYTIGTFPGTWRAIFLGGSVQNTGLGGSPGLQFNPGGVIQKDNLKDPAVNTQPDVTVFFAFQGGDSGSICSLHNINPITLGDDNNLLEVIVERDGSITVQTTGAIIGNTQLPVSWKNWYFLQLNATFDQALVGGIFYVKVTVTLALQGQILINNLVGISNVPVSTLVAGMGINCYDFGAADIHGATIDNVRAEHPSVAINTYPHPGTPFGRFSQAIVELAETANLALGRVSQAVVELSELPTTQKVRASQLVIEIIANLAVGEGWMVYEA